MNRILLKTPEDQFNFEIQNGLLKQRFTWWDFNPDWDTATQLRELGAKNYKLSEVLRVIGSHATLWLDNWKGMIAPMDVQPEGWCYPNGDPLEPEWWWQWHPENEGTQVTDFLNSDPIEAWESKTPLKVGIPFQFQRSIGEVAKVDAIPVMRLPGLVKKNVAWFFEFE